MNCNRSIENSLKKCSSLSLPLIHAIDKENIESEISFGSIFALYNRVSKIPFVLIDYDEMSQEQRRLERYLLTHYGSCDLPAIVSVVSLNDNKVGYFFHTSQRTLSQNCPNTTNYQRIYHLLQLGIEPIRMFSRNDESKWDNTELTVGYNSNDQDNDQASDNNDSFFI